MLPLFTATFWKNVPARGFCQNYAASVLLPDFRVVHAEVAGAGKVALPTPDFQQDLILFGLSAKFDRVAGVAHRLAVDFHDNVAALQSGVGGI
jgi:hypothetical protein